MRVGIEIGGTFTDLVAVLDDGRIETAKALSTPRNPAEGALAALLQWRPSASGVTALAHGSTVATNAVLERKGAVTALAVTQGHRDVLEIQRHEKSDIFDLHYEKPVPLVPRSRVIEVRERLAADGRVVEPLRVGEELATSIAGLLEREHIASIAITLLHSYIDDRHERQLAEFLASRFPALSVTLSSRVNPEYREYERASTTVMSAYLRPVIDGYMRDLSRIMREQGFLGDLQIMQSGGGVMPVEAAREQAVNVILSGPAAGAVGAAYMARETGYRDLITLDMGGTSADISLVRDARPSVTFESRIEGLPIRVPSIDIHAVGAGGGSIAWIDPSGGLRVGPQSAGADPGPCCYGRGGVEPTVTDANTVLGLLRPQRFFGGRIVLERDRAEAAIARLGAALTLAPLDVAEGIRRIANANMIEAIRLVSIERGHDPREFALLAFGGAGGLHACDIARELQIPTVIVPENQGVLSAFGLLVSDYRHDLVQTMLTREREIQPPDLAARFAALAQRACQECARYGLDQGGLRIEASVGLRYLGQASELDIAVNPGQIDAQAVVSWVAAFHSQYRRRFGHSFPDKETQIVNLRVVAVRPAEALRLPGRPAGPSPKMEAGRLYTGGAWTTARFAWRPEMPGHFAAEGPLVVEDHFATTFVPAGWRLRVHENGTLVLADVTDNR